MKTIILSLLILLTLTSCDKKIRCGDPSIFFGFVSMPASDFDTIIITKFVANNNFQTPLDTLEAYLGFNSYTIATIADTNLVELFNRNVHIKQGFDWKIFLPATNTTYNLSQIETSNNEIRCATFQTDCFCYNEITKLSVNNQNAIPASYRNNILYLR